MQDMMEILKKENKDVRSIIIDIIIEFLKTNYHMNNTDMLLRQMIEDFRHSTCYTYRNIFLDFF